MGGLVQERHNSIANALELRLSCTNPWNCDPLDEIQLCISRSQAPHDPIVYLNRFYASLVFWRTAGNGIKLKSEDARVIEK